MAPDRSRPALIAVLAVGMVLASGIAGVVFATTPMTQDESDPPDGAEVIAEFRDEISSLETARFTRNEQFTFNNNTHTNTVDVEADLEADQKRIETDELKQVWDEETVTTYNVAENTVGERERDGTPLLPRIERLVNETMIGYEYLGTDSVDGEDVHVLEAIPQRNVDANGSLTISIDTGTYFPVKVESQSADVEHSVTARYENVTLDGEIPASTFELDLPDDVENRHDSSGPDISEYDTYENAVSNTEITLPPADLTGSFTFDSASVFEDRDIDTVSVMYTDGEQTVTVNVQYDTVRNFSASDRLEPVDIGEETGYISVNEEFVSLQVEDDRLYSIHGAIDEQTATDIAEALVK